MSKPSFFYEPEGTKYRPASLANLFAFFVGRFLGKMLRKVFPGKRQDAGTGRNIG
jgi:hypothetical protein